MRRLLVTLAVLLSVAGCGDRGTSDRSGNGAAEPAETTATAPAYRILSQEELTKALLGVNELPPGYSQDPPSAIGPNKTFCDYPPPFEEKTRVHQDFTKGAGLSAEVLSVGLRQYADADQAKESFTALVDALATCTGETYNGVKSTYAPMSAPKVGEGSVGVKITAGDTGLLQFFAVIGPVLVNTGGGGLMNANADEVLKILTSQVDKYRTAAVG
jgi:hypothetical protein